MALVLLVVRLEDRESEMKKEYTKLHERYTDVSKAQVAVCAIPCNIQIIFFSVSHSCIIFLFPQLFKTHMDYMERSKMFIGSDKIMDMGVSPRARYGIWFTYIFEILLTGKFHYKSHIFFSFPQGWFYLSWSEIDLSQSASFRGWRVSPAEWSSGSQPHHCITNQRHAWKSV